MKLKLTANVLYDRSKLDDVSIQNWNIALSPSVRGCTFMSIDSTVLRSI